MVDRYSSDTYRDDKDDNVKIDTLLIASRKISMWRIILLTLIITTMLLLSLQYVMNKLERSICESNITAFRNSVLIYEQLYNGFPDSLEELERKVGLMGQLDHNKYQWVSATNGGPPHLLCKKFDISSDFNN